MVTQHPPHVLQPRLFSVDDFERMVEAGLFDRDEERVELIAGEVVCMAWPGTRHQSSVDRTLHAFASRCGDHCIVRVQGPLVLGHGSCFQPDVALLRPRADFYRDRHPRSEDVLLVVEVADSSLRKDLEVKVPLYSRAGVPEVWVNDVNGRIIHRFTGPRDDSYSEGKPFTLGDKLVVPESDLLLPVVDIVG